MIQYKIKTVFYYIVGIVIIIVVLSIYYICSLHSTTMEPRNGCYEGKKKSIETLINTKKETQDKDTETVKKHIELLDKIERQINNTKGDYPMGKWPQKIDRNFTK
jgi:hypothetical protein